jgi:hypothetical protein
MIAAVTRRSAAATLRPVRAGVAGRFALLSPVSGHDSPRRFRLSGESRERAPLCALTASGGVPLSATRHER